jgi:hypothetical protein
VLLVFRGTFTEEKGVYKGTSPKSRDNNGNVVIWTSNSRTSIWSGVAAFTELKDGTDYGLIPYNRNGERMEFSEEPIILIWPCGLGIAQTIAGMVFKLTYGSLGIMYDTTEKTVTSDMPVLGHVLSFSAGMDLSFLVPAKKKTAEDEAWEKLQAFFSMEDQDGRQLRNRWAGLDFPRNYLGDGEEEKEEDVEPKASIMVDNILYGCGKGFIGFRCSVSVGLPAYIDAMPAIKAKLDINTIGNWSFGVEGECKFATIEIEVEIEIKSYKGAPIPDKLYFHIAGFEPGINVDGFGVLWITGGGGGFDDLYETIFASKGIPPLKILLSISFDIIKVLSAKAQLSLSLREIGFKAHMARQVGSWYILGGPRR